MTGIVVFVLVLAAIFAIKAVSIMKMSDDVIWKSTAFSIIKPVAEDAVIPEEHTEGAVVEDKRSAIIPAPTFPRRHVSAA